MISLYVDVMSVYIKSFITVRSQTSHIIFCPVRKGTEISTLGLKFCNED